MVNLMLAYCYAANHSHMLSCNGKAGDARLTCKYIRALDISTLRICSFQNNYLFQFLNKYLSCM